MRRTAVRIGLAGAMLAHSGCHEVTGPELVRAAERIEAAVRAPLVSDGEFLLRDLFQTGPWSSPIAWLEIQAAGSIYQLNAVVVEGVTVPVDPDDGYICPRVNRSLIALGEKQMLVLTGLDFSREFSREIVPCPLDHLPRRIPRDLSPQLWTGGIPVTGGGSAIAGKGKITLLRLGDPCPFVPKPEWRIEPPTDVRCELAEFEVEADATLRASDGEATFPLRVKRQTVPGIRLTVYCERNAEFTGCSY